MLFDKRNFFVLLGMIIFVTSEMMWGSQYAPWAVKDSFAVTLKVWNNGKMYLTDKQVSADSHGELPALPIFVTLDTDFDLIKRTFAPASLQDNFLTTREKLRAVAPVVGLPVGLAVLAKSNNRFIQVAGGFAVFYSFCRLTNDVFMVATHAKCVDSLVRGNSGLAEQLGIPVQKS